MIESMSTIGALRAECRRESARADRAENAYESLMRLFGQAGRSPVSVRVEDEVLEFPTGTRVTASMIVSDQLLDSSRQERLDVLRQCGQQIADLIVEHIASGKRDRSADRWPIPQLLSVRHLLTAEEHEKRLVLRVREEGYPDWWRNKSAT